MKNFIQHFESTLTSSSHANFRLDIFDSLNVSLGRESGLKTGKICKKFSHLNICLHSHIFICLHIAYEHNHLTPGTSHSFMNIKVAAQVLNTYICW